MSKITILLNHVLHQDQGENIKSILALDAPPTPTETTDGFPSFYCHQEIQAAISKALSTHLQAIKKPQENGKQTQTQRINSGNSNKPNSRKSNPSSPQPIRSFQHKNSKP